MLKKTFLKLQFEKKTTLRFWDIPAGSVLGLHASMAGGMDLIPGQETKILHAAVVWPKNLKKKTSFHFNLKCCYSHINLKYCYSHY